jgi:hypothetical protein
VTLGSPTSTPWTPPSITGKRWRRSTLQRGDQASFEAVAIVRGMIEAIKIKLATDRMELSVVSNLASFLHREQDGNLSTTLVVAGVGFEPTTFRL